MMVATQGQEPSTVCARSRRPCPPVMKASLERVMGIENCAVVRLGKDGGKRCK